MCAYVFEGTFYVSGAAVGSTKYHMALRKLKIKHCIKRQWTNKSGLKIVVTTVRRGEKSYTKQRCPTAAPINLK